MSDTMVIIESLQARVRQQAARIAELEEELRQTRGHLISSTPLPKWTPYLTATEETMLRCLMARELVSHETLMYTVWPNGEGIQGGDPSKDTIAVWVHKLRKKLGPMGVVIVSIWYRGYQLAPESRAALNDPESISPAQSLRPLGGGDNDHDRIATRDVPVPA